MDKNLELELRAGYSKLMPSLNALSLWVENYLKEILYHCRLVYNYNIRIKSIESLIGKVDKLVKNGVKIESFEQAKDQINDFVGARLLIYVFKEASSLHSLLISDRKMTINSVNIHYHKHKKPPVISELIEKYKRQIDPKEQINETGYTGIHYIMKPNYEGLLYENTKEIPFDKFELQIRSIMQHAWTEIQHKLVYKGKEEYGFAEKEFAYFTGLSEMINTCDGMLAQLSMELSFTPTNPNIAIYSGNSSLFEKIANLVNEIEHTDHSANERYRILENFIAENNVEINKLQKTKVDDSSIGYLMELAELYLKGSHFHKAYEIYEKCKKVASKFNKYTWYLLRHAEASFYIDIEKQEVIKNIYEIKEILNNREPEEKDDVLCGGAAYLLWKCGLYEDDKEKRCKLLEDAAEFSLKALNYFKDEDNHKFFISFRLNLVYYYAELFNQNCDDKICLSNNNYDRKLIELQKYVDEAMSKSSIEDIDLVPSHLDTLAWYYYQLAISYEKYQGDINNAHKLINKAHDYIEECFRLWRESKKIEARDIWREHSLQIREMKNDIETKLRPAIN